MADAKDVTMRALTGIHRAVFRMSYGRLANRGYGMSVQKGDILLVILEP